MALLADVPTAIPQVARMRWLEWGHPPEPDDPAFWLEVTRREAGRSDLPVTFVARASGGDVVGAVGLDTYDLDERHETSPWVTGTIVRRNCRGSGVGRILMQHLEQWAVDHEIGEAWVGTAQAATFYRRCGWVVLEDFTTTSGQRMTVLHKRLV